MIIHQAAAQSELLILPNGIESRRLYLQLTSTSGDQSILTHCGLNRKISDRQLGLQSNHPIVTFQRKLAFCFSANRKSAVFLA